MDERAPDPIGPSPARGRASTVLAACALAAALALPSACLAPGARDDAPAAPRSGIDAYRLLGGEARSVAGGCRYAYRVYEPPAAAAAELAARGAEPATVVLGHGFLRDQDTMVGLARALAAAGLRVATLDFCNMRPWNGHHARNARDMRALAGRVASGGVIYAGFSAGALAALLAASEDPAALGAVTLDLVDQGGLGRAALARLKVPLIGLAGPPSACNAQGNARALFAPGVAGADAAGAHRSLETIAAADHCEFESPSDGLCERLCGDDDAAADDARTRAAIIRRTVEAALGLLRRAPGESGSARPGRARPPSVRSRPRVARRTRTSVPAEAVRPLDAGEPRRDGARASVSVRSREPCRVPARATYRCLRPAPRLSSAEGRAAARARLSRRLSPQAVPAP